MTLATVEQAYAGRVPAGEASLIERARRMEGPAWDELYTLHYPAIHRYCAYRIAHPEAAEDLAADVFLQAVRGIRRYQYRGLPFRAWLYRIAHNVTADERKRLARANTVAPDAAPEPADPDFAPGVVDRRAIATALVELTDEQQQVIILRFLEGLSLQETATVMRKRTGAIKALQFRAVSRLREILQAEVD
ncbi:MAG: sigma-70 family RNA polymerase sigma factor [Dehalococcoidia bacterium]|nr:sigma-70 family RNA polymerase sigma factor [Dehalococcoidia bacterium]MCB9486851.1 sigma-70 family RNA polymerase sigma factor [Thermoflexaceae bacterium]